MRGFLKLSWSNWKGPPEKKVSSLRRVFSPPFFGWPFFESRSLTLHVGNIMWFALRLMDISTNGVIDLGWSRIVYYHPKWRMRRGNIHESLDDVGCGPGGIVLKWAGGSLELMGKMKKPITSLWFSNIFYFYPDTCGNDPIWLIFLNWVETTN